MRVGINFNFNFNLTPIHFIYIYQLVIHLNKYNIIRNKEIRCKKSLFQIVL